MNNMPNVIYIHQIKFCSPQKYGKINKTPTIICKVKQHFLDTKKALNIKQKKVVKHGRTAVTQRNNYKEYKLKTTMLLLCK